jgi:hypothetical protein
MHKAVTAATALSLMLFATAANAAGYNVTISTDPTSNETLSHGTYTATGPDAVLNIGDLKAALATDDLTVTTGTTGTEAGDLVVAGNIKWSANKLTLFAAHSIIVHAKIKASATAGLGFMVGYGGSGGDLIFDTGVATFASTSEALTINVVPFTLVTTISALSSDISGNPSGNFALAKGITSTGTYGRPPIPTTFNGTFEGLGNKITNLTISDSVHENTGLFVSLGTTGVIRNLTLGNMNVSNSTNTDVGGLVVGNSGLIFNVLVGGQVSDAGGYAGGLAAFNTGTVENCRSLASASTTTTSTGGAGSLVAINSGGTITNSSATGAVSDTLGGTIGGLVGVNTGTTGNINTSFATGDVNGIGYSGGLVGTNAGSISESYATGDVTGGGSSLHDVGGLVGHNTGTIRNTYARGNATGGASANVGGLIGYSSNATAGSIASSYSIGVPAGSTGSSVGGLVGFDATTNSFSNTYWNTTTSGITDLTQGAGNVASDPGITGLSGAQLRSGLPAGFDPAVWIETSGINNNFPYLIAIPPS